MQTEAEYYTLQRPADLRCRVHEEVRWNLKGLGSAKCWVCGEHGEVIPDNERPIYVRS